MRADIEVSHPSAQDGPAGLRPDQTPQELQKRPFDLPRLRFVAPTLTARGDLLRVTAGFIGTFSP